MQKEQWDASYSRGDNFLFYPQEEVIRFASKFIRKRVGLSEFKDVAPFAATPKLLDLGCGIGRHVFFAHEMGLEAYGVDLSETAIRTAWHWAEKVGLSQARERIRQGDITQMPWSDGFFDFVVSHGVLDSLHYELAKRAVRETARVIKTNGLFYCDLISGDDIKHAREFAGEEIVQTKHEEGTVQSFFNHGKIRDLFEKDFEIVEALLIRRENVVSGGYHSRHHLTLKKRAA